MRNVSSAFKERMDDRRDFYAAAEITFADGTVKTLTEADFNIQGNSIIQGGATNSFPLGVLSSKQITLSLLNNDDKWEEYGFYNAQIKLVTNYQTNEPDTEASEDFTPVVEKLQEGIFTVITPETYGTTIEITAMDESYKTDKEYSSLMQFPARMDDALRDCCAGCGVTLYSVDIPNRDFIIKKKPEGITYRDFIGDCAMIAGGNAVMDNYNRLKIITYDFSAFSDSEKAAEIPTLKDFKPGLRLEAIDVEITGLQITGEVAETDEEGNETTTTETFKYGEDGYVLTLTNELAAGNEEAFLQAVGDIIVGSKFRAFSGDSIADPLLEFMDVVYVQDYKGRVFQSFISDIDFSYFGTTVIKCSADSPLRNNQGGSRDTVKQLKQLIEKEKTEREKALERLNQMLKDSSGFYSTADEQPDGSVVMYIHNKPTIEESQYVIKITGEAMGISNDGGETYIYGLTYDGEAILRKIYAEGIDADYITTGHLSADMILGGILELGGWNNQNGILKIIDENGEIIGTWDKDGITILKGKLSAALIVGGILTLGGLNNQHGKLNILDENGNLIGIWDKDGITATKGNFAGNITIGGTTDGVCRVLNSEGKETSRIDTDGFSVLGSDGALLINFDWTGMWVYNDKSETKQKVGQIGLTFRGDDTSKPGVILGLDPDGEVIGFGVADSVSGKYKSVFAYARTEDTLAADKDLNMNGHRIYNALLDWQNISTNGYTGVVDVISNVADSGDYIHKYLSFEKGLLIKISDSSDGDNSEDDTDYQDEIYNKHKGEIMGYMDPTIHDLGATANVNLTSCPNFYRKTALSNSGYVTGEITYDTSSGAYKANGELLPDYPIICTLVRPTVNPYGKWAVYIGYYNGDWYISQSMPLVINSDSNWMYFTASRGRNGSSTPSYASLIEDGNSDYNCFGVQIWWENGNLYGEYGCGWVADRSSDTINSMFYYGTGVYGTTTYAAARKNLSPTKINKKLSANRLYIFSYPSLAQAFIDDFIALNNL